MRIDLNADLGESFGRWELGDDEALLAIVTSANIACGFHAGDPTVLRRACRGAVRTGAAIGAQVGYRDLAGFGRRFIDAAPEELADDVLYQIGALDGIARASGGRVAYVKPHGALYNAIVHHEAQAGAVAAAVRAVAPGLPVLGLPGSAWLRAAEEAGLRPVREAFADRAYTPQGTLVPRREPGAVLHDPDEIAERCVRIVRGEPIAAVDGTPVRIGAESLCVHGDTPGAVETAQAVAKALRAEGMVLAPFAGGGPEEGRGGDG
ncbi:LamB/YcsF family protein [Nocardiopsis sp. RSe5-2]|uniref:5-oxoprolinase subunit A n=1 Tax=Nocardiopsis endophytica TaxID=3018445 RepID=A0ABT4U761_9ACTN|nr:5-oxoprolinase subunit PxpA [Nocardiopsis endophytica]MDA2812786.1 LamB/YcsF family protein [Nocardiopsis endophytica]